MSGESAGVGIWGEGLRTDISAEPVANILGGAGSPRPPRAEMLKLSGIWRGLREPRAS